MARLPHPNDKPQVAENSAYEFAGPEVDMLTESRHGNAHASQSAPYRRRLPGGKEAGGHPQSPTINDGPGIYVRFNGSSIL